MDQFDSQNCIQSIQNTFQKQGEIQIDQFCNVLKQYLIFMKKVSTVISMAFNDIKEKCDILEEHSKIYNSNNLYQVIEEERKLSLLQLNGDNNKSFTKDSQYMKYSSSARTVKVLQRFFNFMISVFQDIQVEENSFAYCIKNSYKKALSEFHPWLIRKSAEAMFNAVPKKEAVLSIVGNNPLEDCRKMAQELQTLNDILLKYYQENQLTELP